MTCRPEPKYHDANHMHIYYLRAGFSISNSLNESGQFWSAAARHCVGGEFL